MTGARAAKAVFIVELILLAIPALFYFGASFLALAELSGSSLPIGGKDVSFGPDLVVMIAFGLFALAFTSFLVLAFRYLAGGGESVGRVTPIVWALAILGQAIAVPTTLWTALDESAPSTVRGVALLTFPALGLLIPLAHMFAAALLARRGQARPNLA